MARKCSNPQCGHLRWIAAFSMVAILAVGTLSPPIGIPYQDVDKLVHWAAFCAIGTVLLGPLSFTKTGTLAVLCFLAFALEGGQFFVPGRTVSLGDLSANLIGILCAFTFVEMALVMRRNLSIARTDETLLCRERAGGEDTIRPQPQPPLITAILFGERKKASDGDVTETA